MSRDFTTKPRPDQPGRCPSIDPHDTLQCTRAIHDDDQCQAGGIAWRKGSPRIEWDRERADRLQKDVERMQKDIERLTTEREWFKDRFPCDGVCVDAPEEACSRHGRNPADLWRIIGEVAAERNALAAAHARESEKVWKVEEVMDDIEGSDPTTWERLRAALAGPEADTTDVDVCSGDADCTSTLHVHGCFADTAGPCTDPDEHQPTDQEADQ